MGSGDKLLVVMAVCATVLLVTICICSAIRMPTQPPTTQATTQQ